MYPTEERCKCHHYQERVPLDTNFFLPELDGLDTNDVAVVQYVVCWLIRRKSLGSYPRSVIKKKKKKNIYFFGDFLSADFWQKHWE